jgi:hypothetical protein
MTSTYERKPKCENGNCTPWIDCREIQGKNGMFKVCLVCENAVYKPRGPKCSESGGVCTPFASAPIITTAKGEFRKCLICDNLVFDNSNKKPYKRPYEATKVSQASVDSTVMRDISNLNTRLALLETKVQALLENKATDDASKPQTQFLLDL